MSARLATSATALCVLCACYSTGSAEDDPALRGHAGQASPELDASSPPEVSAPADAAITDDPALQVWVGAAHRREGLGLICGPDSDGSTTQARALLLLERNEGGQLIAGSLTLGEGPPLPPVEDPDAYYPPDPPWEWHGCPMLALAAGFEYALYDARLVDGRLTASIHPADLVKEWCELQPSYRASPVAAEHWGDYLCRPTDAILSPTDLSYAIPDPSRNTSEPSPFVPEELCFNVNAPCVCDADSCTASPYRAKHLELQLTGNAFSGRLGTLDVKLERGQVLAHQP